MIKFPGEYEDQPATLKVVGVGGGGGNAVNRMIQMDVRNVEFIAANTDAQWLKHSSLAPNRLQLGTQLTKGLGAGGDPERGRLAALESESELRDFLLGTDMVFITAGMGGGTGTGAAPVVAKVARDLGILTVGVVTRPFEFEGRMRANQADSGIKTIRQYTDTLIVIPNDRLFAVVEENTPREECFHIVDDVLRKAVQAISDVITRPQDVNMDFANVRALMTSAGEALMGVGEESGANRAIRAAKKAIESPLLENVSIDGAKGVLVNISGKPKGVTMHEVRDAMHHIHSAVSPDAKVFLGLGSEEILKDSIRITVIATGFPPPKSSLSGSFREKRGGTSDRRRDTVLEPVKADSGNGRENVLDLKLLHIPAFLRRKDGRLK